MDPEASGGGRAAKRAAKPQYTTSYGSPLAEQPYDMTMYDRASLGEALVQIAGMEHLPKVFAAGGDALDAITPVVEARLASSRPTPSSRRRRAASGGEGARAS